MSPLFISNSNGNPLATAELLAADPKFVDMDVATDEDEHSIEMHLPYVRKAFEGCG